MARKPTTRRRATIPQPSMWQRIWQNARDNPIKWGGSVFALIVAAAAAWPIVANWEPIVRWRMADFFDQKMTPFVSLTEKLNLGNLYDRCDKTLKELKTADDKTQVTRRIRHLDIEIKAAEAKTNTSEYGGCKE